MKEPNEFSLESLMAEEGMFVTAGLPEGIKRDLQRLAMKKNRTESARALRTRLEQILSNIAEHEAKLAELQQELQNAMKEYTAVAIGTPAA